MRFAVAEVVIEMVAPLFQGVVVFVFENEVEVVEQDPVAERLMGIEIIAKNRLVAGVVVGAVRVQPTRGGIDFAVLFFPAPRPTILPSRPCASW